MDKNRLRRSFLILMYWRIHVELAAPGRSLAHSFIIKTLRAEWLKFWMRRRAVNQALKLAGV